ncbi:MAG TPA: hypothetical protein VMV92_31185 [Streptosporangiaceae bacterium]|nr:hypothetical protein [Streptosporangiaceae bacterium]HVB41437.1 hypothetical protein [Streptosporangiaceae bacterium]
MTPEEHAERERRWAEYERRQRDHECAQMRWHWDGAYEFGHDGQRYWARRTDSGTVITEADLLAFREAVRLDYCRRPVPRDATRG